jgi:hypothetical protein
VSTAAADIGESRVWCWDPTSGDAWVYNSKAMRAERKRGLLGTRERAGGHRGSYIRDSVYDSAHYLLSDSDTE